MATATTGAIEQYLGAKSESLLGFKNPKIAKERLHLPGPDFIDRVYAASDRNLRVLNNIHRLFFTGRLSATGYLSILPVALGRAEIDRGADCRCTHVPRFLNGAEKNLVELVGVSE